ncbi:MAG: transcriptional activator NhaR [Gemmataceae bacterium]|nr:transcriptional activator NhaR [Gemmataceae bacterium]
MYYRRMEWLNYQHLLYFWTVAREGSVKRACEALHLAQPTISGQIHALERSLGNKLFQKAGRNLVLTEAGRVVFRYADEIFSLGKELRDTLKGRPAGRPQRFLVGVADALPKLIIHRLLEPALHLKEPVHLICHDGRAEELLAQLALHQLDLVLLDMPSPPTVKIRAYDHLLGESPISIFAAPRLAARYRSRFPECLENAPFLMPAEKSSLRRALDQWFETKQIRPDIRGEFSDSALLKVFGQIGAGLFAAPSVVEKEICRQYHVKAIGRLEGLRERFYAVSVERRLKHPAVVAISEAARKSLFVFADKP